MKERPSIVKVDRKWRVLLPQRLRSRLHIDRGMHLEIRARKDSVLMKPVPRPERAAREREIKKLLSKPVRISKGKLKKINLERIEEEMWSP